MFHLSEASSHKYFNPTKMSIQKQVIIMDFADGQIQFVLFTLKLNINNNIYTSKIFKFGTMGPSLKLIL